MVQLTTRRSRRIAMLLAPILLIGATPPTANPVPSNITFTAKPPVPVATEGIIQPFDIDASRRMAVEVTVEGQGPFSFLVDTGAERTVISRELANRLKLDQGSGLRLATISGSSDARSYQVASLEMANLRLNPFEAPALYGRHIGAAGLVGVDMLQNRRILINFVTEQMKVLESHPHARPLIRNDDAIVVEARNIAGRLILSDARIDGKQIKVIIDTGAQTSVGNLALKRLVSKRRQNLHPYFPTLLMSVTGKTIPAEKTQIKRIAIEGVDVNDLPIAFADSQAFRSLGLHDKPALLLGMDCLQMFDRIEIDFVNRRIVLDLPDAASRKPDQRLAMTEMDPGRPY